MRKLTTQPRTGAFTTLLSLLIVALFAYANLICAAGGATSDACAQADADHHCETTDAPNHHDDAPTPPSKDCSKDSCFCITMNTVATQTPIAKPHSVIVHTWLCLA